MKIKGKLKGVSRDWETNRWNLTFEMIEGNIQEVDKLRNKELSIEAGKFYDKRSGRANRMLWACMTEIAQAENPPRDKWDVYMDYIKRQGQCTMMQIYPEAFDKLQKQWREVEIIGHPVIGGREMLDVLCYFGSSTYNSREFSVLLNEVIEDMRQADLPTPTSEAMERAIAELEEQENGKKA